MKKHPRSGKAWHRQEAKKAMDLLASGYEADEVAQHLGRPVGAISTMLATYGLTVTEVQMNVDKKEALKLEPLKPYSVTIPLFNEAQALPAVEVDTSGVQQLANAPGGQDCIQGGVAANG